jgi:hypothetical protein
VSKVCEKPSVRYFMVGRLVPGEYGYVWVIPVGIGEIGTVHKTDLLPVLGGLGNEWFRLSETG